MKPMKPKVPAAIAARPTQNTSANVTNMREAYDNLKALASFVFQKLTDVGGSAAEHRLSG